MTLLHILRKQRPRITEVRNRWADGRQYGVVTLGYERLTKATTALMNVLGKNRNVICAELFLIFLKCVSVNEILERGRMKQWKAERFGKFRGKFVRELCWLPLSS